jgi:arsenate reductase
MKSDKPFVLVMCTGNSMRSQLAEGILRQELGDKIDVVSAGTHPSYVYPAVLEVLKEIGIETSGFRSKNISEFFDRRIDLVITLCDHAQTVCPSFPGAKKQIHHGYPDPTRTGFGMDEHQVFVELSDQMRRELTELVVKELQLSR